MALYGSLRFACTDTVVVQSDLNFTRKIEKRKRSQNKAQPSRRSVRIMAKQSAALQPSSITKEPISNVNKEIPKKRRGRKLNSKKIVKQRLLPTDKEITMIRPSNVAASKRKYPEKILHIDYETKEILIQWKNIANPEYLDRSSSIAPEVLALILEFTKNPAPVTDTQDMTEKDFKEPKTTQNIADYRRKQRSAMPKDFVPSVYHIKTE